MKLLALSALLSSAAAFAPSQGGSFYLLYLTVNADSHTHFFPTAVLVNLSFPFRSQILFRLKHGEEPGHAILAIPRKLPWLHWR